MQVCDTGNDAKRRSFCLLKVQKIETTLAQKSIRNASKLKSLDQDGTHLVCNEVMTTLMEFEAVLKAICQKADTVDMDHHAFLSSILGR